MVITCLGIESTAHTFGIAIVQKNSGGWRFLANIRKSFTTQQGGLIPSKVSDHHVEHAPAVLAQALEKAGLSMKEIDLVTFSQGPGIGTCLRVGGALARSLSLRYNLPLVGVNHCVAHLEIGRVLASAKDPLLLYASGANTQIIGYEAGKYRVFGETLDIGIGNFLDQVARSLNLGFPGGPAIEKLAQTGTYYELPYTVKGMDVQFGGLVTRIKKDIAANVSPHDICRSVQETAFAMLVEVAERALAHTGKTELVLGGGVACNKRLQEMSKLMCEARGATSFAPTNEYLVDNAAMIALTGILEHEAAVATPIDAAGPLPHWRTDDVIVVWR